MTRDDLIERLLYGMFEGTYGDPVPVEWIGLDRETVDKILEMCLTDKIPAFDGREKE